MHAQARSRLGTGSVSARPRLGPGSVQAQSRLGPGPVPAWSWLGPGCGRHLPAAGNDTLRLGGEERRHGERGRGAAPWAHGAPRTATAAGPLQARVGGSPGCPGLGTRRGSIGPTWAVRGPGRGGARGARWPRALTPVMNLDDIQLPLLLNSLAALALAETSGGSPAGRVTRCRGGPDNRLGRRRPRTPAAPGPASAGLRPPGAPAGAPTSRTAAGPVFGAPRAGWSGDRACFRAHLPANALTLSAPIIIQSALRRAAIP